MKKTTRKTTKSETVIAGNAHMAAFFLDHPGEFEKMTRWKDAIFKDMESIGMAIDGLAKLIKASHTHLDGQITEIKRKLDTPPQAPNNAVKLNTSQGTGTAITTPTPPHNEFKREYPTPQKIDAAPRRPNRAEVRTQWNPMEEALKQAEHAKKMKDNKFAN